MKKIKNNKNEVDIVTCSVLNCLKRKRKCQTQFCDVLVGTNKNKIQASQRGYHNRKISFFTATDGGLLKPLSCRQENPGDRWYQISRRDGLSFLSKPDFRQRQRMHISFVHPSRCYLQCVTPSKIWFDPLRPRSATVPDGVSIPMSRRIFTPGFNQYDVPAFWTLVQGRPTDLPRYVCSLRRKSSCVL